MKWTDFTTTQGSHCWCLCNLHSSFEDRNTSSQGGHQSKQHGILHPAKRHACGPFSFVMKAGGVMKQLQNFNTIILRFACCMCFFGIRQTLRLETNHCVNFIHYPCSKKFDFSMKPTFNMIRFVMNFLQLSCFWFSLFDGTCETA